MAAPLGNTYYTRRKKDGKELKILTPEELFTKAISYFEWCDQNPWCKKDVIKSGARIGEVIGIPLARPYTIEGLCVHIGICVKTFYNYANMDLFSSVITHIREVIRQNQMEGAIVGAYNANIISRILGYVDKQDASADRVDELIIESESPHTQENLRIMRERLSQP